MHNPTPPYAPRCPKCCAMSDWVVQTPALAYFYCTLCKEEVESPYNTKSRFANKQATNSDKNIDEMEDALEKLRKAWGSAFCN